ncbi:MAG: glycosyl transferase [Lachnospiraceae bacterium]|nr:glycosyl transferase [Lachnospiraceae bacterium]
MLIQKLIRYARDPKYRFLVNASKGFLNRLSDEEFIHRKFRVVMGCEPNLEEPKTFNEKLQWLKLYDHNPKYTDLVDKEKVKEYVSKQIGREYVIPTLGVWDSFEEIDFDALPDQFVLKCTHDSGGLVICKDKSRLDKEAAKQKIDHCLTRNFFYYGREWPYKNVKPRILAEPYLEDAHGELNDYKIMCFGGEVKCSFVCTDRFNGKGLKVTFFDKDWERMTFERHYPASSEVIDKPEQYEEMCRLAEILSEGIPFVRVDFYDLDGKVLFGEMTFFPGGGFEEFTPEEWDRTLGDWIVLPPKQR